VGSHRLRHGEVAFEIDVKGGVPVRLIVFSGVAEPRERRVIDENIDATVAVDRGLDDAGSPLPRGRVGIRGRFSPGRSDIIDKTLGAGVLAKTHVV
jgi:hypothetical protein